MTDVAGLIEGLVGGDQRALARAISVIEDRAPGYRELVSALYRRPADADVIGVTGSPGVGKSTLVDALAGRYSDRGRAVGVVAIDPSSPFTGGALLGDRVRMAGAAGNEVFVRSMSARGTRGGLAAATMDAVRALAVSGRDLVIVETVGAGQNEVDVVATADSVVVVTQPESGDDVQALKAGLLEIGDVYAVNKADRPGADRTAHDLREMIEGAAGLGSHRIGPEPPDVEWTPPVVETSATEGTGLDALASAIDDHLAFVADAGLGERKARVRCAEEIRTHLDDDVAALVDRTIEADGGMDALVDAVLAGDADPYGLAEELLGRIACDGDAGEGPPDAADR